MGFISAIWVHRLLSPLRDILGERNISSEDILSCIMSCGIRALHAEIETSRPLRSVRPLLGPLTYDVRKNGLPSPLSLSHSRNLPVLSPAFEQTPLPISVQTSFVCRLLSPAHVKCLRRTPHFTLGHSKWRFRQISIFVDKREGQR